MVRSAESPEELPPKAGTAGLVPMIRSVRLALNGVYGIVVGTGE